MVVLAPEKPFEAPSKLPAERPAEPVFPELAPVLEHFRKNEHGWISGHMVFALPDGTSAYCISGAVIHLGLGAPEPEPEPEPDVEPEPEPDVDNGCAPIVRHQLRYHEIMSALHKTIYGEENVSVRYKEGKVVEWNDHEADREQVIDVVERTMYGIH